MRKKELKHTRILLWTYVEGTVGHGEMFSSVTLNETQCWFDWTFSLKMPIFSFYLSWPYERLTDLSTAIAQRLCNPTCFSVAFQDKSIDCKATFPIGVTLITFDTESVAISLIVVVFGQKFSTVSSISYGWSIHWPNRITEPVRRGAGHVLAFCTLIKNWTGILLSGPTTGPSRKSSI